jgi:hypothetical protein
MARQFRVQVRDAATSSLWRQVAAFRLSSDARRLADELCNSGQAARVVEHRTLPTAA